ncbi:MAG: 3'(2'),5'-bisphosphate nucleotidase CysQ [Bacteroidales bacterium]|nr:3'(2'),5'-bisphosphate nucleotidase CysQ [Bacteroidales bacterium]
MKNIKKLLSVITSVAIEAGEEIMDIYNSKDFEIKLKSDNSPLTIADKNAHNIIFNELSKTNFPILSEEGKSISYKERKKWEYYWLVDPLDGTKEFIKRNGEFTVNIALIHKDTPIMGIVYAPFLKDLYIGSLEYGSFKISNIDSRNSKDEINIDKLMLEKNSLPFSSERKNYTVVGSRSHMNEDTEKFIDNLREIHGDIDFISKGSSLKLCMVAEGQADIYPRFAPTMEWDTGAGHAIATGAGFSITQKDEKTALIYNKENLLNPWFIVKTSTR